ncbi:MAG TPA: threonine-phosphate decarboxylase CobD [Candidatus Methanoperedens sp.]|nr:threonine-phosphate decarboxylase CobD [Candidatus Methanoperedens sp.]
MNLYNRVRKPAINLIPCTHGARVQESAETAGKSAGELLDYSVSLNPLGAPKLNKILAAAYKTIDSYPDNRYPGFKKAAAGYLNIAPENIVPGNGSSELIRLFAEVVIEPGDKVGIPFPTFGEYEFQCRLFGAEIEHVDYGMIMDVEPEGKKAIFLCNPNNPTGRLMKHEEIMDLAQRCIDSGTFLFVDEAFIELSDPQESIALFASSKDFVVVLRSLTKTFVLPGLRIGFAVASEDFAGLLNNVRLHWNLNSIAVEVGEHVLKNNRSYIKRSLELIKKEREWLSSKLNAIRGFKTYPSDANFILVDASTFLISSFELAQRLLSRDIIIRECASFVLENHIRVAVRKRSENRRLIRAISGVISERGSELAEKEIGIALKKGVIARSRINCEYYPCHFEGQDCTFCFCPFYPCEDRRTGGERIQRSAGGTVWSCAGCSLIHEGEIAEKVLKSLMSGKKLKEVWKLVIEPVL